MIVLYFFSLRGGEAGGRGGGRSRDTKAGGSSVIEVEVRAAKAAQESVCRNR